MGTVTLRPDGRWQITYEVASGVETTLATPATTRAEAERLLRHCEMQTWAIRATGVPLAPEPEPFSAIWEWWARACLPRYSPHWRRTLQQQARDYLLPAIGYLHPGEIRPSIIAGLMRSLRDSGRLGDRGCNSVRSLAKIIIRDAIGDGRWPLGLPNPAEHVRQRQIQAKHWPTLTAADVARLIARTSGRRQCMWAPAPKPKRSACPSCGRLYRVAGVAPQIRAHDLRHTFTTLAAEASVNPEVIRMTTGHSGDQASRYCHLSIRAQRNDLSGQTEALLHDCLSPTPEIALDAQDAIGVLIRLAAAEAGAPIVEIGGVA